MATVRSFRALRPDPKSAAAVSAVPYDVVSTAEARALAAGNPLSFLHVSRPEIDLEEGADPHADAVYARAAENFAKLRREAPLAAERAPSLYLYRLRMGDHEQTGVAGCASIDEYDRDVVRKHERTRKDKEDDRTRHMVRLRAQTGPVFLTYRDRPEIDGIVEEARREAPLFDFTAPDGVVPHGLAAFAGGDAPARDGLSRGSPALHRRRPSPRREREPRPAGARGRQSRPHGPGALQLLPDGRVPRRPGPHPSLQPRRPGPERQDAGPVPGRPAPAVPRSRRRASRSGPQGRGERLRGRTLARTRAAPAFRRRRHRRARRRPPAAPRPRAASRHPGHPHGQADRLRGRHPGNRRARRGSSTPGRPRWPFRCIPFPSTS